MKLKRWRMKRKKIKFKTKMIASFEMILMISLSFAVAGILNSGLGSALMTDATEAASTMTPPQPEVQAPVDWSNPFGPTPSVTQGAPASVSPYAAPNLPGALPGYKIGEGTWTLANGEEFTGTILTNPSTGAQYGYYDGWYYTVDKTGVGAYSGETIPAITKTTPPAQADLLGSIFGGKMLGTATAGQVFGGALISGAVWGAIVGGGAYFIAKMFGQTDKQAASIGMGLGAGTFVGSSLYLMGANAAALGPGNFFAAHPFIFSATGGLLIGGGIAAAIIILTYKKEKKEIIQFQCLPWEAPTGGRKCEECNEDPLLPCSEYRCKSLGQACEIVNAGTANELCVWVHPDDTSAPMITPWEDALRPKDELRYVPDNAVRPPARGAKITKLGEVGGCLQAYTKLQFGITTDEPAKCRIDYNLVTGFDNMSNAFGNSLIFAYNHTQQLRVPSPFTEADGEGEEIPEIHTDGTYSLYARCMDANGNYNIDAFSFRFCVGAGPDTTQPKIEGSDINDGSPVQSGVDSVPIEVYVNEPAECRWSRIDKDFSDMENKMTCATESYQINSELNYVCSGTLTGIKDKQDNNFFFRCMDYGAENRNVMTSSFPLTLKGTEELVITKAGPTGTIEGSTTTETIYLTAETAHGANEGKSVCYFDTDSEGEFDIAMEFSDSYTHNQSLDLSAGNYIYYFQCVDDGGNAAYANTNFTIHIDKVVPTAARVYRDADTLTVVTDEEAKCAYSLTSCNYNFEEGKALIYENAAEKIVHYTEWDSSSTYYIKCMDLQGNEPSPTACSIIAKGSEL